VLPNPRNAEAPGLGTEGDQSIQQVHADSDSLPRPYALWADPVRRPVRAAYVRAYASRYESGIASGNLDAYLSGKCDMVPMGRGSCDPERAHDQEKRAVARILWTNGVPENLIRDVVGIPEGRAA
jgi:hypothetical protein